MTVQDNLLFISSSGILENLNKIFIITQRQWNIYRQLHAINQEMKDERERIKGLDLSKWLKMPFEWKKQKKKQKQKTKTKYPYDISLYSTWQQKHILK